MVNAKEGNKKPLIVKGRTK